MRNGTCGKPEVPERVWHLPADDVAGDGDVDGLAVQERGGVGPAVRKHVVVVQPKSRRLFYSLVLGCTFITWERMTGPTCRPTLLEADLHSTQDTLREFAAYDIPVDEGQGKQAKAKRNTKF